MHLVDFDATYVNGLDCLTASRSRTTPRWDAMRQRQAVKNFEFVNPRHRQCIGAGPTRCWRSLSSDLLEGLSPHSGDKVWVLTPLHKRGSKSTKRAQPLIDRRTEKPPTVPRVQSHFRAGCSSSLPLRRELSTHLSSPSRMPS